MTAFEKIAYIKGLMEGLNFDTDSAEGKIMMNLLEAIEILADEVDGLNDITEAIGEEVDAISDDLLNVEEYLFDDEDDCDCCCDCDDDDYDCCCDGDCDCEDAE